MNMCIYKHVLLRSMWYVQTTLCLILAKRPRTGVFALPRRESYEGVRSCSREELFLMGFNASYRDFRQITRGPRHLRPGCCTPWSLHRFPVPSESLCPASLPGPSRSHGCVFLHAACTSRPVSGCGSASLLGAVPAGPGCPPPSRQPPLPARGPAAGSGLPGAGGRAGRPLAAPAHHAGPAGWEQARGGAAEAAPLAPLGESIAGGSRKGGWLFRGNLPAAGAQNT